MEDYTLSLPEYLTCNCVCFKNEDLFPRKKLPSKPVDYIKQENTRCNSMVREISKHQLFDIEEMKPCYGVSTTTASTLRSSLFRHENTLKKLKNFVKTRNQTDFYIRFENGKEVSVDVYLQTIKQLISTNIQIIEVCSEAYSPVCVSRLKISEKQHLSTLAVFENVVYGFEHGNNQLELSIEPPIGVY